MSNTLSRRLQVIEAAAAAGVCALAAGSAFLMASMPDAFQLAFF